jgi:hypothetical protein
MLGANLAGAGRQRVNVGEWGFRAPPRITAVRWAPIIFATPPFERAGRQLPGLLG